MLTVPKKPEYELENLDVGQYGFESIDLGYETPSSKPTGKSTNEIVGKAPGSTTYYGPGTQSSSTSSSNYQTGYTYTPFQQSSKTNNYEDVLKDLEDNAPGAFQSQYDSQIDQLITDITNRESFNVDDVYDSDLYKNMKDQTLMAGNKAMRDAMGQIQQASGGYGSSYAQTVGQQSMDNTINQLGNNTLAIHDRVYNQYLDEGLEMYKQLGMYNEQDAIDYDRYRDDVSDYYTDLNYYSDAYNNSYNRDFGEYSYNDQAMKWAEEYAFAKSQEEYQKQQDALAQQNWQTQFDYNKGQDALAQQNWQTQWDYQLAQDALKGTGGGGSGRSSSSSSKKETSAGYAPIAAGVVEQQQANGWTDAQTYDYIMKLGDEGKINLPQADQILKKAGLDEKEILEEKDRIAGLGMGIASPKYEIQEEPENPAQDAVNQMVQAALGGLSAFEELIKRR